MCAHPRWLRGGTIAHQKRGLRRLGSRRVPRWGCARSRGREASRGQPQSAALFMLPPMVSRGIVRQGLDVGRAGRVFPGRPVCKQQAGAHLLHRHQVAARVRYQAPPNLPRRGRHGAHGRRAQAQLLWRHGVWPGNGCAALLRGHGCAASQRIGFGQGEKLLAKRPTLFELFPFSARSEIPGASPARALRTCPHVHRVRAGGARAEHQGLQPGEQDVPVPGTGGDNVGACLGSRWIAVHPG
mmetsp:Transcript_13899/g.47028  ORF Transcript_13899/g.47028 Transcript_13899/m.47028 type:complete len:241 (-) Transcript_13899:223-945(-)